MTTLRVAQIVARAAMRIVGGDQRIIVLAKDEEGREYRLVVIQDCSLMERSFESFPDAFARFLDYANLNLVLRNDVLSLEAPEGADVEIRCFPSREELLAAWKRIGGKIKEEGAGEGG
ncbi:hypothetical protein [Thermoflexus sp.]|jgi:hypothetical protein|uniref:hypothetical protein n=1 Tax=Thermoflexus sp. TaxID=1969742 RepID=UPI003C09DAC7